MIALQKKDGGIRPIAIGNTLRRLVAKLACMSVREEIGEYFRPHQLGFGTQKGCETIIHTVRTFIDQNSDSNKILVKIDFKNAFNCIERDSMLQVIKEKVPKLYPFLWQSYRNSSNLYFNSEVISSQRGAQQGDPTGPMIFCLTIHPTVLQLNSRLNLFYLDDGILGDEPTTVLQDLQKIVEDCKSIGLEINPNKCELYFCSYRDENVIAAFEKIAPGIKVISRSNFTLLGSPLMLEAVETTARQNLDLIKKTLNELHSLNCHTAYYLLKIA